MLPRDWHIKEKNPKDIIEALLKLRGITDLNEFFNPQKPETFSLKDFDISDKEMKKAVKRIHEAKEKKQVVVIYGDYDVDGVCATSILWEALHKFGIEVFPFIPDRFSEGYGMSLLGVEKLTTQYPEVKLIITVDNGIVAQSTISQSQNQGIDVIVTDHHEASGKNSANALVHTTRMCGTAIAWTLARELLEDKKFTQEALDLVGIATIADQMKLVGINRSFALYGLIQARSSKRVGLNAMCENAQIEQAKIGTYEVGFVLGPRLNAAGRLSHALDVVRLLCTSSEIKAFEIARSLTELNLKRQEVTVTVLDLARAQVQSGNKVIIVKGAFHEGVIGLAAGKLVEETGKPAIVFSESETHIKGSARSISGFHITDALLNFKDLFLSVGGHEMAAGLSLEPTNYASFLDAFVLYVNENLTDELLVKKLNIDCQISFSPISRELSTQILKMEPFGMGNPKPVFMTEKVEVVSIKLLGVRGEHMKLVMKNDEKSFDALIFRISQWKTLPKVGTFVDLVYSIDENTWNGKTSIQLMVKDFHTYEDTDANILRKGVSEAPDAAS